MTVSRLFEVGLFLRVCAATAAVAALSLLASPTAGATMPGSNGKIAFQTHRDGNTEIYVVNPDGTGATNLTNSPGEDFDPAWSPDGTRIAYNGIRIMNADGSGKTTLGVGGFDPSWSPDGTKIAFVSLERGNHDIYVMNSDGTGATRVTTNRGDDVQPAWSPDGTKILFRQQIPSGPSELASINPDGTGLTLLTANRQLLDENATWSPDGSRIAVRRGVPNTNIWIMDEDGTDAVKMTSENLNYDPAWSPDGTKIAFASLRDGFWRIYTMNVDGTGHTPVTSIPSDSDRKPDWQPVPKGYARPQGASAGRVPLAIAYDECGAGAANRTHGPSLSNPSCAPPVPSSDHLTVGTLEANGKAPRFNAFVRFNVCQSGTAGGTCSNPPGMTAPDVRLEAGLTDVRRQVVLTDYIGELQVRVGLRITDKDNSPAPPSGTSGTVTDVPFAFTVPCTATSGTEDIGANCAVLTRVNAVVPGALTAGKRAIWEMTEPEVFDGGPDGLVSTADNTLFARQGIFVP